MSVTSKIKKINLDKKNKKVQFKEEPKISFAIGTNLPPNAEYLNKDQTDNPEGLTVKTPTKNTSVNRLGLSVDRENVNVRQRKRPSGFDISSTVTYGDNVQSALSNFNRHRQGKDVKNYSQAIYRNTPIITFSERSIDIFGDIDHNFEMNVYGQGSLFKIYDENFKLIPFRDYDEIIPKELLGQKQVISYPFVHDLKVNFSQFVDPSLSTFDGSIDVFNTKNSLINTYTADFLYNGIKADYMGAGIERNQKGNLTIDNIYIINNGTKDYFLDSQENLFQPLTTPQAGVTGSSGKIFSIQGYSSSDLYIMSPFKEKNLWKDTDYNLLSETQKNSLLSGSNRDISPIGERFKSATCGLLFGESNAIGTDSIAFGGLKK